MGVVAVDLVLGSLADERVHAGGILSFSHSNVAVVSALADGQRPGPDQLPGIEVESAPALVQQKVALGGEGQNVQGDDGLCGGWTGVLHDVAGCSYTEQCSGEGHG